MIKAIVLVLVLLFPMNALGQDKYYPYRLPEPTLRVEVEGERYAAYNFSTFQLLLKMDNDFRQSAFNLRLAQDRIDSYSRSLYNTHTQLTAANSQLRLCTDDRTRLTEKWEKETAARHKAEAKSRSSLFAVSGWTIAGVSLSVSIGLLIGLLAQ